MVRPALLGLVALGLTAAACQAQSAPPQSGSENAVRAPSAPPAKAGAAAPAGGVDGAAAPAPGTAQRRALMDAVRPAIETALRSPVEFVVQRAAVQDGWALVIADPQRPGGGVILAPHLGPEEERDGLTVNAVLRFRDGRWNLIDYAIGPTDVWYCGLQGPPRSLLGC
jgi:hypothetical protein